MRSYEITRPNSCTATRESASFATGIYPDRIVGRYRHHCDPRGNAVARVVESQDQGAGHELDLVFLDVQMPKMSGFDVVRTIGAERMPAIIFVTAFDRFAMLAFEVQALDYLLKPFGEERVRKALNRARTFLEGGAKRAFREQLTGLLRATAGSQPASCLLVKGDERMLVLQPREIDWVEAEGDYVRLHVGQESLLP
jgi:two-component system LytT family response regulator